MLQHKLKLIFVDLEYLLLEFNFFTEYFIFFFFFSFNLICFSSQYEMWSEQLEPATLDNCYAAMDWMLKLRTCGSTKTFEALKVCVN